MKTKHVVASVYTPEEDLAAEFLPPGDVLVSCTVDRQMTESMGYDIKHHERVLVLEHAPLGEILASKGIFFHPAQ